MKKKQAYILKLIIAKKASKVLESQCFLIICKNVSEHYEKNILMTKSGKKR